MDLRSGPPARRPPPAAALLAPLLLTATAGLAAGADGGGRVAELLDHVEREQRQIRTLEARFVQRKESLLLVAPEEATGLFSYQAPDRVRWEFLTPNHTVVVIRGSEMLTWYQDLGTAERLDVSRQANRIFEYLGASNSIDKLERYFTLTVHFPAEATRPFRLELAPRFGRVAQHIAEMVIELDPTTYLPRLLRYVEPDGDTTELSFEEVRRNVALPAARFELELPPDVEVRTVEGGAADAL